MTDLYEQGIKWAPLAIPIFVLVFIPAVVRFLMEIGSVNEEDRVSRRNK